MKILMIGAKQYLSREGGVDIVVERLAEEMSKLGHEVTVLTHKRKGKKPISYNGKVHVKEIFTIEKKSTAAIIYSYYATKYAKRNNFDIVHFHAEGNTLFLKKLRKRKNVVVTIHGLDWKRGKFSGFGAKVLKKSEKQIVKYANEVTTLVKNDADYFDDTYGLKTTIIPNGVDEPILLEPNIIANKYGLSKEGYILFLARIVPEKGLHYLVDAYSPIQNCPYKLVIAGGESHSFDYYQKIKDQCVANKNIIFTGFVAGEELKELFSNAYFYVLPSDIEGMPLSLIEALSYKNVCLCSDIKELKDIKSENICYFKHSDVNDLKTKLIELINNRPVYKNEKVFDSWSDIAQKYIDVYKKVLG